MSVALKVLLSDRLTVIVAAMLLDGLLGGPRKPHIALGLNKPAQLVVALVKTLERKLNRDRRKDEDLIQRGMMMMMILLAGSVVAGMVAIAVLRHTYWGGLVEIVLVATMFSLRQDADFATELGQKLVAGDGAAARDGLTGTAWRNAALLDGHGICRAAIETIGVHFADRVVSPAFWYLLFGLPGIMACRMMTTLADVTGHGRDAFSKAAFYVTAIMHFIPSVFSGVLVVASSLFLPFGRPLKTLWAWANAIADVDYRRRQVALFGAALNTALGGTLSVYAQGPWVGGAVAKAYPVDIRRCVLLLWFSSFLLLLAFLLVLFLA